MVHRARSGPAARRPIDDDCRSGGARHPQPRLIVARKLRVYQIAKNCRTSVEMIEKYYAAHIKARIDAAAINKMRPRLKKKTEPHEQPRRSDVSPPVLLC